MLDHSISFIFTLIESILLYWMINRLLHGRVQSVKKMILLSIAILTDTLFVQFSPSIPPIFKPVMFIVISTAIVQLLYSDSIFIKFFFVLSANYIFLICDIVTGNFLSLIYKTDVEELIFSTADPNRIFAFLSKAIAFIIFGLFIRFFKKIDLSTSKKYWLIMNLVLIIFIVLINFFMAINSTLQQDNFYYSIQIFKISICFLIMTFLVIYLFGEICLFYQKEQLKYALELKNKMLEQQIRFQETSTEDFKKIRHDIKNNLTHISYLLKENHIEDSVRYIEAITDTLNSTKSVIHCGNKYMDAIMNYGVALCKKNNVKIQFEVANIPDLEVIPTDLSSIISNILDNAVEANLRMSESERYLSLKVFCYKNYLSVIVKNPYKHTLIKSKEFLLTDKQDKIHHGYGLKSIKSSVEKYGGSFKFTTLNQVFTSIVILPIHSSPIRYN